MNDALFHSPYYLLNIITIFVLILPLVAIVLNKASRNIRFLPIAILFALFLTAALLNNRLPDLGTHIAELISTICFLFLSPVTLYFLQFFHDEAPGKEDQKRAIRISLIFYLLAGMGIFAWKGLDEKSGAMMNGLGFLLVLVFGLPILFRQIKETIHHRMDTGKAFMIAAIVFSFACYSLIFLMNFVFRADVQENELFLLFQFTTIFFALLMAAGIFLYKPKIQSVPLDKKAAKLPMLTEWEQYTGK